ncbi:MAG: PhoU domain-containing protein [Acidimicrobiales bacterium]
MIVRMESRNLREMLAEAKDTSELMVDLAYAALYFDDADMADEVDELENEISSLVHRMRTLCIVAVRNPREAEAMAAVLQVISALERIANDAVDIARIVTRLGHPSRGDGPHRCRGDLASRRGGRRFTLRQPPGVGLRAAGGDRHAHHGDPTGPIVAGRSQATRSCNRATCCSCGSPDGIARLRELAAPMWNPPPLVESAVLTDLDRAVDTLIEMNLSEVAVGLAYSSLIYRDRSLAAEVRHLEDRLDEMNHRLELWVLRCATDGADPAPLRGLLHLGAAAEDIGDQARAMVWMIEQSTELHPVLGIALGDTDDVVVRMPVGVGAEVHGRTLAELELPIEPGFNVLAIEREGRYWYRPRKHVDLREGDLVLASGPEEGRSALAELLGWRYEEDDDGEIELSPLSAS